MLLLTVVLPHGKYKRLATKVIQPGQNLSHASHKIIGRIHVIYSLHFDKGIASQAIQVPSSLFEVFNQQIQYETELDSNEATFYIDGAFSKQPKHTSQNVHISCQPAQWIKLRLHKMMLFLSIAGEELLCCTILPNTSHRQPSLQDLCLPFRSFRAHIRMTKIKCSQ